MCHALFWPSRFCYWLAGCYGGSRPPRIGTAAPEFTLQDSDHKVSLNDYRGKVVLLNFWATWCPPCIAEMPSLIELQKKMKDKDVVILGVSIDEDEAAYHKFLKNYGVNFVTVMDKEQEDTHDLRHIRLAGNVHHRPARRGTAEIHWGGGVDFPGD